MLILDARDLERPRKIFERSLIIFHMSLQNSHVVIWEEVLRVDIEGSIVNGLSLLSLPVSLHKDPEIIEHSDLSVAESV